MSDQRPRPQFGEYATPEEQQKAIKVPLDDAESVPVESQVSPSSHISVQTPPQQKAAPGGNRFATVLLLGIGLVTILVSLSALADLPTAIDSAFSQLGVGDFTAVSLAATMGWTAIILEVALWGFALWLSLRALKRGKAAWWIPLVFGVVANLVVFVCVAIAMAGDPSFMEYVNRTS
ncbi:hypothetical protein IWX78_002292 [Mycetocola sp. CAN_C7]|uniref:DUF6264 family protein n=1 Tax=Mycetocola sp. CAN_C7 TaxID=2787724 RepID=UPI0018CA7598